MAIDDELIILGSSNMDSQSWYRSSETDFALDFITPNSNNPIFAQNIIRFGFDALFERGLLLQKKLK